MTRISASETMSAEQLASAAVKKAHAEDKGKGNWQGQLAEEKVSDDVLTTVMSRVRVSSRGDEASDYDYIAVLDFEANCIPQRGRDAPEWDDL